jgi:hypothetical protein
MVTRIPSTHWTTTCCPKHGMWEKIKVITWRRRQERGQRCRGCPVGRGLLAGGRGEHGGRVHAPVQARKVGPWRRNLLRNVCEPRRPSALPGVDLGGWQEVKVELEVVLRRPFEVAAVVRNVAVCPVA